MLADPDRAGEGHQIRIGIGDHRIAHGRGVAGDHREHLGRQPGLVEHVGQRQRGQRRQFGRLEDEAVIGGDRRGQLVADHVERMVERGDRRDHAEQRLARGEDLPRLAVRRDIAGEHLAIVLDGQLCRERPDIIGTAGLVERVLPAQAGLGGDQPGEFVPAIAQELGGLLQDLLALIARELRLESPGLGEGFADMLGPCSRDQSDDAVVIGVPDLDHVVGRGQLAGDPHRLAPHRRLHSGVHLSQPG